MNLALGDRAGGGSTAKTGSQQSSSGQRIGIEDRCEQLAARSCGTSPEAIRANSARHGVLSGSPIQARRTVGAILARYAAAPWVGSRDDNCKVFGRSMDGQRAFDGSSGV